MRRALALLLTSTVPLLSACASDEAARAGGSAPGDYARAVEAAGAPERSTPTAGPTGAAPRAPAGRSVVLPKTSVEQLEAFLDEPRTVLGNQVEISMSRRPFLARFMVTSPIRGGAVARDEVKDASLGLLTITLENVSGTRTVLGNMPRVRLGDGLEVVAVDKLVIRVWDRTEESLPVFLEVTALGDVLYVEEGPPVVRQGGGHGKVGANISGSGSTYTFSESWEVR